MTDLLTLDNVNAGYAAVDVLRDVSLNVREGGTLALLGRNGVGKTTLLQTVMGLTARSSGTILFRGRDIVSMAPHHRNALGIALVPQEREVFPSLSVEENLKVAMRPGDWTLERIYELFPRLQERRGSGGGQLSGGEQQMLAIGRALAGNPSLLLLDEPFEGLAPVIVDTLIAAIDRIRVEGGITSIVVEHQVDLALQMAEDAIVLDRGQVAWRGTASDLSASPDLLASLIGLGGDVPAH